MSFRVHVERLDLAPNSIDVARRLGRLDGVAVVRAEAGSVTYVAAAPCDLAHTLDPEPALQRDACAYGEVPRWIGMLPYEALRELELQKRSDPRSEPGCVRPLWLRYRAVVRIGRHVDVLGESSEDVARLVAALGAEVERGQPSLRFSGEMEPAAAHVERIQRALAQIQRGSLYEVNLARRFELEVQGTPWELLEKIEEAGAVPHAFALKFGDLGVVAASPELCLALDPSGIVSTSPIKGTRPRHANALEDARLACELDQDSKERAELTMIIDVERNDLGRVARIGSVRLVEPPHVVALPSVHHRLATIEAELGPELTRTTLFRAVLPSGSVTGAPKRRAMQLIAELEPHRRGLYTGVVGFIRQDGGVELKMAIRTLVYHGERGHYFAGGGIVADSEPDREVAETLWKAERLFALAGAPSTECVSPPPKKGGR